jgi:hypothetical protein
MITSAASTLTLEEITTELVLLGTRQQAWHRRREIDRLARERIPRELADRLDQLLTGWNGVIRIRTLRLELDVGVRALQSGALVDEWARRLADALVEELRHGASGNVAFFDSAADYAAAYMLARVEGREREIAWQFGDFAPLRYLSPAEAAVAIVQQAPACLPALAQRLKRTGAVSAFAAALGDAGAQRLLQTAAQDAAAERTAVEQTARPATEVVQPWLGADGAGVALLLHAMPDIRADAAETRSVAAAALALARCRSLAAALEPAARQELRAALESGAPPAGPSDPAVGEILDMLSGATGGAVVAALLPGSVVQPPRPPDAATAIPEARHAVAASRERTQAPAGKIEAMPEPPPESVRSFRSRFAGLCLVLPVIRALDLPARLGLARTREAFAALIGDGERPLLFMEPLLNAAFPLEGEPRPFRADAQPPQAWPEPLAIMLVGLPPAQKHALVAARDSAGYAHLIAAHIATRLYGLHRSSLPYLRREFLERPGTVTVDAARLHVRLDPVPLGAVLRLSGLVGDRGELPWAADRSLRITLLED